jgi:hypothetical protein
MEVFMVSHLISAKGVRVLLLLSPFVLVQGCIATRGWVGGQINPVNDRLAKLEAQLG